VWPLIILVKQEVLQNNVTAIAAYKDTAEKMMCSFLPETNGPHMSYTPGGLIYKPGSTQLQNTAALSFLLLTYADYLSTSSQQLNCGNLKFQPDSLRRIVKRQVYIRIIRSFFSSIILVFVSLRKKYLCFIFCR